MFEFRPQIAVDASEAWFWTERWRQMEREADEDYASGWWERFDDVESFLANFDARAAEFDASNRTEPEA